MGVDEGNLQVLENRRDCRFFQNRLLISEYSFLSVKYLPAGCLLSIE